MATDAKSTTATTTTAKTISHSAADISALIKGRSVAGTVAQRDGKIDVEVWDTAEERELFQTAFGFPSVLHARYWLQGWGIEAWTPLPATMTKGLARHPSCLPLPPSDEDLVTTMIGLLSDGVNPDFYYGIKNRTIQSQLRLQSCKQKATHMWSGGA